MRVCAQPESRQGARHVCACHATRPRRRGDRVKRREFISLLGGAVAVWPLAARAQQAPPRILRVGTASPNTRTFPFWMAFDQRMRELGYIEGQNLAFEFIHTGDRVDRMSEAIRDLVRRKVDIIVESSGTEQGLKEAIAATSTLPIVMIAIQYDPIALGHVDSVARPTGNVTGVYLRRPELVAKQVEMLAQLAPGSTRLGVLWDMNSLDMFKAAERAAASLNMELRSLELENPPYDFSGTAMVLALSRTCLKASTVLTSGFGVPARTATPRGTRARSTSVPATILFAATSSLRPSLERITTLAGTPRASCAAIVCGPVPCDAPDPVVTLMPLVRSNSSKSSSYAPLNPPDIKTFNCADAATGQNGSVTKMTNEKVFMISSSPARSVLPTKL